jgi:hypothetical protein
MQNVPGMASVAKGVEEVEEVDVRAHRFTTPGQHTTIETGQLFGEGGVVDAIPLPIIPLQLRFIEDYVMAQIFATPQHRPKEVGVEGEGLDRVAFPQFEEGGAKLLDLLWIPLYKPVIGS